MARAPISPGSGLRFEVGILVHHCRVQAPRKALQATEQEIANPGSTKPDRVGEALGSRDPEVGEARREIEHVPRLEHPFPGRLEGSEDAQVETGPVVVRRASIDLPTALALPLEQEDVVTIHMGPHGALRRGKAHHDVVHPPTRQEAEGVQQIGQGGHVAVGAFHEERPVAARQPA